MELYDGFPWAWGGRGPARPKRRGHGQPGPSFLEWFTGGDGRTGECAREFDILPCVNNIPSPINFISL